MLFSMAPLGGIEPPLTVLESAISPRAQRLIVLVVVVISETTKWWFDSFVAFIVYDPNSVAVVGITPVTPYFTISKH